MASPEQPTDPKVALLLEEIRDDLRKQGDLKKEVLQKVKPSSRRETLLEISRHPVILLIIGSLFGGWLSSCYQRREWDRQQYLARNRQEIEQKVKIQEEIVGEIVEAHAAARNAIRPLFYEDAATFKLNEEERSKEWNKVGQNWESSRSRIEQKLKRFFRDSNMLTKFSQIVNYKNPAGNTIFIEVNNVLAEAKAKPGLLDENISGAKPKSDDHKKFRESIRTNILTPLGEVRDATEELSQLMQNEIKVDIDKNNERPSFWSRLFGLPTF